MTVASIDIGTNTIILLVAEVNLNNFEVKTLENHHSIPRIGRGLKKDNPISTENIKKMHAVISRYADVIKKYNCEKVLVTGTNALRISSNRNEIVEEFRKKFNYTLNVVTGEEEARYSYLGAVNGYPPNKNLLVIDIGGGSTEIIFGIGANISFRKSFPIGAVSGRENYFTSDPPFEKQIMSFSNHIKETISEIAMNIQNIETAIAIAGTPTTLACIKQNLKIYDEDLIEGSVLSKDDLEKFIGELSKQNSEEIKKNYLSVVEGREDVLLAGTIILNEITNLLKINEVTVSTKGIRYGAIINWMNPLKS